MNFNLALPFYRQSLKNPSRLALSSERELSYSELASVVRSIAGWLHADGPRPPKRVGILASRSVEACAGVLGACWAGASYVPISLKAPEERLLSIVALSELDALVTDVKGAKLLSPRLLEALPPRVLVPDECKSWDGLRDDRRVEGFGNLSAVEGTPEPAQVDADDIAYIIFTSGTTGVPKGVMISAGSVQHYLSIIEGLYQLTSEDRISQAFDLSFDVSVASMFMTWGIGASLHVVPENQAIAPVNFIQSHRLTLWWSVPSIIAFVRRMRGFGPDVFPTLRYSLFAGEPLPLSSALAWQSAAPGSIVENAYGPTEATITCLHHRMTEPPLTTSERATISIGTALAGTRAAIIDPDLKFLPAGERGELVLAGAQLATGYLGAPQLTADRFPVIGNTRWYRTGDFAYEDERGNFHHLGRIDNQVKVLGNRVELEDVDAHLQKVSGSELAASVAWPITNGSAAGIVGFVSGTTLTAGEIREALKARLPTYMVPSAIQLIPTLPMTANGKVDRKALVRMLEPGGNG